MRVCFICRKYDRGDPVNGGVLDWIDRLAQNPRVEEVFVLTLEPAVTRPSRAGITLVPHSRGRNRVHTLGRFYRSVMAVRGKVDAWFVWQGGLYPILLKMVGAGPIFQWKAHPRVEWWQEVCSRWCSRVTFTSTPFSYPGGGRVVVVGHGVDTEKFKPGVGVEREIDYLMVGRVTRSKRIELGVEYLGEGERLVVVGPTMGEKDEGYLGELIDGCEGKDVRFEGPKTQEELVWYMQRAKVLLNFSTTALDRVVLEALACGVEVVSSNVNATWILAQRKGRTGRELVVEEHSVESIWDRVLPVMEEECERS